MTMTTKADNVQLMVKFAEHPQYTMRFGELLLHAFLDDRENAIKCAVAIMLYVSHHGRIRDRLASDIAKALSCQFH
jgi:hypothetical protein